jgi:Uma2 family endonuclease
MAQELNTDLASTSPASAPLPRMTYEEFLERCDATRAEWVDGEVIVMSPASMRHQRVVGFLYSLIQSYAETHQLGVAFVAPFQMKLASRPSGREPDVLFVSQPRLGLLKKNYLDGPADLVVEVTSVDSRSRDKTEKYSEYQQDGVREYWLVDPERKQAEFYVLNEGKTYDSVPASDGVYRSAIMSGLWMKVNWLWQDQPPSLMFVLKEWGIG